MNTGIADAVDLAWKLDATLADWGGNVLLASYEAERRPVGLRTVKEAAANVAQMRGFRPDPTMFEDSAAGNDARRRVGDALAGVMRREWFAVGIHVGYSYDSSPICVGDETLEPPFHPVRVAQSARPGSRAPHVWIDEGLSTLDLFGRGFTLLRLGREAPGSGPIMTAAQARGVPLRVVDLDHADVTALYERRFVLVRPDGHVAWRGDVPPADSDHMLDAARGAA